MLTIYKPEDNSYFHWLLNGCVNVCGCSNSLALLTFTILEEPSVHEYWGTPSAVSRINTWFPSFSGIMMSMLSSFLNVYLYPLLLNMYDVYFVVDMHEHTHLSNTLHHRWTDRTIREALHYLLPCTPCQHSNWRRNRQHDSLLIHRWYEEVD